MICWGKLNSGEKLTENYFLAKIEKEKNML